MVASVGRITAGTGYEYLTREVATSKHDYYTGAGETPGRWVGRGAALLGLAGEVDADDMAALYGRFVVPSTADGTRLPSGRWLHEQILGRKVSPRVRPDGTVAEPIAAFDVTFSPSKSVSLLWALTSGPEVQAAVLAAHDEAVTVALEYLDHHAGHTRSGAGGVRKVHGDGFVIAQFRHRTARSTTPGERVGDPQLHSHCAILNRVRGVDGKWRTLDSKAIYRHAHAAGAVYGAHLERLLTERLGVVWETPEGRVPMREIAGIPAALRARFSTRRADVLATYDRLEAQWRDVQGRSPTTAERAELHQQATLRSRSPKAGGVSDLHGRWRAECSGAELADVDGAVARETTAERMAADGGRIPSASDELAGAVFDRLHQQRSWWTRAHIAHEVADLIAEPTLEAIEVETERIAQLCVPLERDDDVEYADHDASKLTSTTILDAEHRVLTAAGNATTVVVPAKPAAELGDDQAAAVRALCAGDRQVQTVVGPAGAGKTTMLRSVADSWAAADREVTVLALSAAAGRVVTNETGLPAHTIASWRIGQVVLPRGGLVIVDEASMVPTLTLDQLVRVASARNTRVALLGDYAQMGSPEAGGLLRDLAAKPSAVELVAVRRFREEWERSASKRLRAHDPKVAAEYEQRGRIVGTLATQATGSVCDAWFADNVDGLDSVIVVETEAAAAALSGRCQELLRVGDRLGKRVAAACGDGNPLHLGDMIQTRRNTRELATSDCTRVLNRDVWRITGRSANGEIQAVSLTRRATVTLTREYVTADVVLAYATTIAGAQGRTTDTGHVVVTPRTSSAAVYVGMTRGRRHNTAHVITDGHDHAELDLGDRTATQAFADAITRTGDGQRSAHSVRADWKIGTPARQAGRADDRRTRAAEDWWERVRPQLPPAVATALNGRDHEVIAALAHSTSDHYRRQSVRVAIRSTRWDHPNAGRNFVRRLAAITRPAIQSPLPGLSYHRYGGPEYGR